MRSDPGGIARCACVVDDVDYRRDDDEEWSVPLHGDRALFEKLSLGGTAFTTIGERVLRTAVPC